MLKLVLKNHDFTSKADPIKSNIYEEDYLLKFKRKK